MRQVSNTHLVVLTKRAIDGRSGGAEHEVNMTDDEIENSFKVRFHITFSIKSIY
jgi:hypothetical protein